MLLTQEYKGQPVAGLPLLLTCLVAAAITWFFLFAVPGTPFWIVIACATFTLGSIAVLVYRDTFSADRKSWYRYILIGIATAVILYGIFFVGNIVVRLLPFGTDQVEAVYGTRSQASKWTIFTLLLFPIGPGEELFWRGFVQRTLSVKLGSWKGFLVATFLYIIIHVPSLNITLIGAAAIAGIVWGLLYKKVGHIGPGIISHAIWDAVIFVLLPLN